MDPLLVAAAQPIATRSRDTPSDHLVLLPAILRKGDLNVSNVLDGARSSSASVLFHRNVAFTISHEHGGYREWEVLPADGPIGEGNSGVEQARDGQGSFRVAVEAAQSEIDQMLAAVA